MITVLREAGFAIRIYKNDHLPVHVHVYGNGEARIDVTNLTVMSNRGMSRRDLAKALTLVEDNKPFLMQRWRDIHG